MVDNKTQYPRIYCSEETIKTAARWSAVLGIPLETFLDGELPPPPEQYDVIKRDVEALKSDIEFLKQEIRQLRETIEHETTASC